MLIRLRKLDPGAYYGESMEGDADEKTDTESRTPNTPSPNSPKQPCVPKLVNSPSITF